MASSYIGLATGYINTLSNLRLHMKEEVNTEQEVKDWDDIVWVSDCCGEDVYEDYDICSACLDHCGTEEQ